MRGFVCLECTLHVHPHSCASPDSTSATLTSRTFLSRRTFMAAPYILKLHKIRERERDNTRSIPQAGDTVINLASRIIPYSQSREKEKNLFSSFVPVQKIIIQLLGLCFTNIHPSRPFSFSLSFNINYIRLSIFTRRAAAAVCKFIAWLSQRGLDLLIRKCCHCAAPAAAAAALCIART